MNKKVFIILMAVLFIIPIFSFSVYAQKKSTLAAEEAVILFIEGEVMVKTDDWKPAEEGMVLSEGNELRTGTGSWAEIGLGTRSKNVVRVKEATLVKFVSLKPTELSLLKGELRSMVESLGRGSTFEIKTPTAICGARGTGWDTYTDGTRVIVDVYEDEVYFEPISENAQDPVIKAGKRGVLEDPSQPVEIKNLPIERMSDWSRWKEDFMDRKNTDKREIKDKILKIQQSHDRAENMMKEKERAQDKKDATDIIDKRIDTHSDNVSTGP